MNYPASEIQQSLFESKQEHTNECIKILIKIIEVHADLNEINKFVKITYIFID
jgi:hypothetical protein